VLGLKPRLSKAAIQLREQFDDQFPERDRASDGWIADIRHLRAGKSDHIPDVQGWVRAIDIDADLSGRSKPEIMPDLADEIRKFAKSDRKKRIAYIIFNGRIASPILGWKWRKYTGANKHTKHAHISFTKKADDDSAFFQIPMLGATNERTKENVRILGKSLPCGCHHTCGIGSD
jgi:hypothetical protein